MHRVPAKLILMRTGNLVEEAVSRRKARRLTAPGVVKLGDGQYHSVGGARDTDCQLVLLLLLRWKENLSGPTLVVAVGSVTGGVEALRRALEEWLTPQTRRFLPGFAQSALGVEGNIRLSNFRGTLLYTSCVVGLFEGLSVVCPDRRAVVDCKQYSELH